MKLRPLNKKGEGLVTGTILGVVGLVIAVIIGFVIVFTILGANLLSTGAENTSAWDLSYNLTSGVNNISTKIPTILTIAAVVLLFGVLVILMARARGMGIGGGGSL